MPGTPVCQLGRAVRVLGTAAAGREAPGSTAHRREIVIPNHFWNVGKSGTDDIGTAGGFPVCGVRGGNIGDGKFRATHSGDVLAAGGKVDGKGFLFGGSLVCVTRSNRYEPAVAIGGDDGLTLRGGLREEAVDAGVFAGAEIGLADAVADADYRGGALFDGVAEGIEDAGIFTVANVDEKNRGARCGAAGVFEVDIRFHFVAGGDGGGAGIRDQDYGGVFFGEAEGGLKILDVGERDGRLADDGDGLSRAGEAGFGGGIDVVNGGDIFGSEEVAAGLAER